MKGYQNYDKSEFASPSPLFDDDAKLEKIYNSLYDLNEFNSPDKFKTYEQLETRLKYVLGLNQPKKTAVPDEDLEDLSEGLSSYDHANDSFNEKSPVPEPVAETTSDEEDDSLSYFSRLVNE